MARSSHLRDGRALDVQLDRALSLDGKRSAAGYATQAAGLYPGFDQFGRVKYQTWADGGLTSTGTPAHSTRPEVVSIEYGYDYSSNRTFAYDARFQSGWPMNHAYTNDPLNRLTAAMRNTRANLTGGTPTNGPGSQAWSLDLLGNWSDVSTWDATPTQQTESRTHDTVNELLTRNLPGSTPDHTLTYDNAGNLASDAISGGATTTYTHDAWNRLVKVTVAGTAILEQQFNGLGWRTLKRSDTNANGSVDEERVTYDSYGQARHHFGADIDGNGAVDGADLGAVTGLWGKTVSDATYRSEADLNRDGTIDGGDIGIVLNYRSALPTGQISDPAAGGPDNVIGWDGYVFNPATADYLVRHRTYLPPLGRWAERDPAGYDDATNLQQAFFSAPCLFGDPSGSQGSGTVAPTLRPRPGPARPRHGPIWPRVRPGGAPQPGSNPMWLPDNPEISPDKLFEEEGWMQECQRGRQKQCLCDWWYGQFRRIPQPGRVDPAWNRDDNPSFAPEWYPTPEWQYDPVLAVRRRRGGHGPPREGPDPCRYLIALYHGLDKAKSAVHEILASAQPSSRCELLRLVRSMILMQIQYRRQYQQCLKAYGISDPASCDKHARPVRQSISELADLDQRIAKECDGLVHYGDGWFAPANPLEPQWRRGP